MYVENALLLCMSVRLYVSSVYGLVCVSILRLLQSHSGLVWETRFDTSIVKITCVQTVIALQTIRTSITHF